MSCPVGKYWRRLDVNTSTRIQIVPFYVSARNVACLPREHICLLNAGSLNRLLLKLLFHQFSFIFIFEILTLWWSVRSICFVLIKYVIIMKLLWTFQLWQTSVGRKICYTLGDHIYLYVTENGFFLSSLHRCYWQFRF